MDINFDELIRAVLILMQEECAASEESRERIKRNLEMILEGKHNG